MIYRRVLSRKERSSKTGHACDPSPVYPPQYPTSNPLGAHNLWDPPTLTPVATPTLPSGPVEGLRCDAQASQEAMAPPSQGQPVRDQPHQDGTLATNDCGPPTEPHSGGGARGRSGRSRCVLHQPPPLYPLRHCGAKLLRSAAVKPLCSWGAKPFGASCNWGAKPFGG